MKKIRWGIAGPGNIANKFAAAVKNVGSAELVGVASRSYDKAKEFAAKYDIEYAFGSYEEMAASDKIDAVYISTIHPFHKPCAELFLNSGKHVLCEKPVCVNTNQAKALKECAEKNGRFLMEAMWTRFLPAIKEVKAMIGRGEIGKVMGFQADFCYRETPESCPILFDNKIAGGSLLDVGIYPLHLAAFLFGTETEEIKATSYNEEGVDVHTQVMIKYTDGIIANLSSAIGVAKPETAYIYGTDGYIILPTFYGASEFILCKNREEKHIRKPFIGNGFEEEIYEVCDCIICGKNQSSTLPLSESIAVLTQIDYIRKQINISYPLEGEE